MTGKNNYFIIFASPSLIPFALSLSKGQMNGRNPIYIGDAVMVRQASFESLRTGSTNGFCINLTTNDFLYTSPRTAFVHHH